MIIHYNNTPTTLFINNIARRICKKQPPFADFCRCKGKNKIYNMQMYVRKKYINLVKHPICLPKYPIYIIMRKNKID